MTGYFGYQPMMKAVKVTLDFIPVSIFNIISNFPSFCDGVLMLTNFSCS